MINEWTLDVGQLPIIDGPCDTLRDGEWVHHETRACVQECEWIGIDELELRRNILAKAVELGATTIVWRMEPQIIRGIAYGAYAICGMYKVSMVKSGSVKPPPNNDGRPSCFWCGGRTEKKQGFTAEYNICLKCKK